jgi:hypothetical protein
MVAREVLKQLAIEQVGKLWSGRSVCLVRSLDNREEQILGEVGSFRRECKEAGVWGRKCGMCQIWRKNTVLCRALR